MLLITSICQAPTGVRFPKPRNCGTAKRPRESGRLPAGHEGGHRFPADGFVTAVDTRTPPPVDAGVAARRTLPGVVAHESARQGGRRPAIPASGTRPGAEAQVPGLRP